MNSLVLTETELQTLLGRREVSFDDDGRIADFVAGKTVVVTGAGGSIGCALCRRIAGYGAKKLVALDICEQGVFDLWQSLCADDPALEVVVQIGSVRDKAGMEGLFARHLPDIVFHAAAHKHVPLMEFCPQEAVKNNVFGTLHVVQAALSCGVQKFVLISTDKAVSPHSIMGATKRLAEMIVTAYARESCETLFSIVRFGNVLGSSGSVTQTFLQQIAAGGPVHVTHPDVARYFMTLAEASLLILQAGALCAGGEIFVLDMGAPVKIVDLAYAMIDLYHSRINVENRAEIDIQFTGLRPGDKLHETLYAAGEQPQKTACEHIFSIRHAQDGLLNEIEKILVLLQLELDNPVDMRALLNRLIVDAAL